jgi:hypothetical protein
MTKCFGVAVLAVWLGICALATAVQARPPTVTNSPGYQARLIESRKALSAPQYLQAAPANNAATPAIRKPKRDPRDGTR